jgi:hypothetical protein
MRDICKCGHTRQVHINLVRTCMGDYCPCLTFEPAQYGPIELMVKPRDFQSRDGSSILPGATKSEIDTDKYGVPFNVTLTTRKPSNADLVGIDFSYKRRRPVSSQMPEGELWTGSNPASASITLVSANEEIRIMPYWRRRNFISQSRTIRNIKGSDYQFIEVEYSMKICPPCHQKTMATCKDYHYSQAIRCDVCNITTKGFDCLWWVGGLSPIVMKESFCFTGRLMFQRKMAAKLVQDFGGEVHSTLSRYTTFLVVGEKCGIKLTQAQRWGVQILTQEQFLSKMAGQPLASKTIPVRVLQNVVSQAPSQVIATKRRIVL